MFRSLPGPPIDLEREPELLRSTCSQDSWARGSHQKVVAFSFYGSTNSTEHQKKKYWSGIEENLALVESLYGEGWSMRLYHDLNLSSPLHHQLCSLACSSTFLDLCPVAELPSSNPSNASSIFPMVWRFLPTLDPQVPRPPFFFRNLNDSLTGGSLSLPRPRLPDLKEGGCCRPRMGLN